MRKSLTKDVAEAVLAAGQATLNDLAPRFPRATRQQLHKALQNAAGAGLIQLAHRGRGGPGKTDPGIWAKPLERGQAFRPVNSVWGLGRLHHIDGEWPIPCGAARQYSPLGPWTEPA